MLLAHSGWANQSSGSIECPSTGAFARISNYPNELDELFGAFEEDLRMLRVAPRDLLGHFLLQDKGAQVMVTKYEDERQLESAYELLAAQYEAWRAGQ